MLRATVLLILAIVPNSALAQPSLPEILSRVSEEADVFQQNIVKTITQETLQQRAVMPPSRFRPRVGAPVIQQPGQLRLMVREIVSEYSVGTLNQSDSGNLLEFRQAVSVDGRPIQSPESARHALSLGMHSPDDRLRKRMLEAFASNGLVDVATDYGLILLAFTRRGLTELKIFPLGEARLGTTETVLLSWQQTSSSAGELEFRGKHVARRALKGILWARKSDGLPLRVSAWAEHVDGKRSIRDEATIDYEVSVHGFLTPASVVHRHIVDGQLLTENLYRYEPFKLFAADAEIKFTEIPDPSTLAPASNPGTPQPATQPSKKK
jgi:hypothetical protein